MVILLHGDMLDENTRKIRLWQLEVLDEKRIHYTEHSKAYHEKFKISFEKKIKPKNFQAGYLILKENINKIIANDEVKGKFEPNWLESYVIVESIGSKAYMLSLMDGKEEPNTFNSMHLKLFYA